MRKLEYHKPYKVTRTRVSPDYIDKIEGRYNYARICSVMTRYGIVTIAELKWETNFLPSIFSVFSTVINGMCYTAWLKESELSDIRLKWMATHFIKTILNPKVKTS